MSYPYEKFGCITITQIPPVPSTVSTAGWNIKSSSPFLNHTKSIYLQGPLDQNGSL